MSILSPSSINIKKEFFSVEKKELDPVEAQEDAVEIGIDDLLYSSDEENIPSDNVGLDTKFDIKVKENLKHCQDQEKVDIKNTEEANADKMIVKVCKEIKPDLELVSANVDSQAEVVNEDEHDYKKEEFKATGNLQTNEELIFNFRKKKVPYVKRKDPWMNKNSIDWREIYKTNGKTNFEEDLKKVIRVRAPVEAKIVHPHEYTVLGNHNNVCSYCQMKAAKLKNLKRHIILKHREVTDLYHCPYCPYTSKYSLTSHLLVHKNIEDLNFFQCYTCEKKFKSKILIQKHVITHMNKEQLVGWLYQCDMCEKSYTTSSALARHKERVHEKKNIPKIYQCDQCSYSARSTVHFNCHIERHHTNPRDLQLHKCPDCPFETKYKYLFDRHRSRQHSKRFICEECGFTANTKAHLELHTISLHKSKEDIEKENLMKYRCKKCDYKTHRVYSLNVHKLNHLKPSEIQYFYCYHCEFKAKRKDNLKTHVLRHFKMDQVKFDCYKCDFSTKKRNLLTKHMEKHIVKK